MDSSEKQIKNKIEANDRTIAFVLKEKKYTIDYFQREYRWGEKHIEQLVSDLTSSFLLEYKSDHDRKEVKNYNKYYLGPFVISIKTDANSIVDGQQRLTSLTLFLIYLSHLQNELGHTSDLKAFIFSEMYGEKSFNLQVEERRKCMEGLFNYGEYEPNDDDDESVHNLSERYIDIVRAFPDELKGDALPYFIDWLKFNVVLVEIRAYKEENAYTIFETMNDRGLNLTPTEMLKSYILSRLDNDTDRQKANGLWKKNIQKLHEYDKDEDQKFVQAWLRAQYADTIRAGKAGSSNEDFEKIGTRFHNWFRDNLEKMNLSDSSGSSFSNFISSDFTFFYKAYVKILQAQQTMTEGLEHIFYIKISGIANSLSYPLMLAPLKSRDTEETVHNKLSLVAKFIETFVVRRSLNYKRYASSSIRYTMYTLVKEIRHASVEQLRSILAGKIYAMDEQLSSAVDFVMHGQNKWFVKYMLSRITSYIEQASGMGTQFDKYYYNKGGKPFEIEHIWADKFIRHRDEFDQENEFSRYRNKLGALVLLPRGTNQSYNALPYIKKRPYYRGENLLVRSLCSEAYEKNPNFIKMINQNALPFKPHDSFMKSDIDERSALYSTIIEQIWGSYS